MATIKLIGDAPNQVSRNRDLGDLAYQDAGALNQIGVNGVKFLGTASTDANTLDDYEEGTWTPVLTGSTSGSITFTTSGRYTKVGNIVTIELYDSNIDATTPLVGNISLIGLPFAAFRTSPAAVFYANLFSVTNLYAAVQGSVINFISNSNSTTLLTESSIAALSGRRIAISCSYSV